MHYLISLEIMGKLIVTAVSYCLCFFVGIVEL